MAIVRNCLNCNRVFESVPAKIKSGKAKYCSSFCFHFSRRKRIEIICEICGSKRAVKPSVFKYGNVKYCSQKCSDIGHRKQPEEFFWKKINRGDHCWIWTGMIDGHGYGLVHSNGEHIRAHRLSWILHFGNIPMGLCVLHKCDIPACVNPSHLFLGTKADNSRDMAQKNRGTRGRGQKLTEEDVHKIKLMASTIKYVDIASQFNVDASLISLIVHEKRWNHIRRSPS